MDVNALEWSYFELENLSPLFFWHIPLVHTGSCAARRHVALPPWGRLISETEMTAFQITVTGLVGNVPLQLDELEWMLPLETQLWLKCLCCAKCGQKVSNWLTIAQLPLYGGLWVWNRARYLVYSVCNKVFVCSAMYFMILHAFHIYT